MGSECGQDRLTDRGGHRFTIDEDLHDLTGYWLDIVRATRHHRPRTSSFADPSLDDKPGSGEIRAMITFNRLSAILANAFQSDAQVRALWDSDKLVRLPLVFATIVGFSQSGGVSLLGALWLDLLLLVLVGMVAGVINAMAGGGTFLVLPILIGLGLRVLGLVAGVVVQAASFSACT